MKIDKTDKKKLRRTGIIIATKQNLGPLVFGKQKEEGNLMKEMEDSDHRCQGNEELYEVHFTVKWNTLVMKNKD